MLSVTASPQCLRARIGPASDAAAKYSTYLRTQLTYENGTVYPVTVVVPKKALSVVARAHQSSPTRTDGSMRLKIGTPGKLSNPLDYPTKLGANGNLLVTLLEARDPRLEHNLGKR